MKIKQVEELVDITGKNIRFYESKGLLNPGRADNGYREYDLNDVKRLKEIKLLRKIGISVEDIKLILEGKLEFELSLTRHRDALSDSVNSIENMIKITDSILSSHSSPDKLDVDMLLNEIENMEKEGAGFVNIDKTDIHMKKKAGALLGATVMIILMCIIIIAMILGKISDPSMPIPVLVLFIAIPLITMIAIIVSMVNRMKEIDRGEEDEAAKY